MELCLLAIFIRLWLKTVIEAFQKLASDFGDGGFVLGLGVCLSRLGRLFEGAATLIHALKKNLSICRFQQ